MDDNLLMVVVAPFYALGVTAVAYATIFMIHSGTTMGQSAVQTKLTETLPNGDKVTTTKAA